MVGPLDQVKINEDKTIPASKTKRPYWSSGKFLTLQFLTDEKIETTGFEVSSTAVRRGIYLAFCIHDNFTKKQYFAGHTCTYEYPKVHILLSNIDSHNPHTSHSSYIESPNFGGTHSRFDNIK